MNASHSVFLKKHWNTNKIKTKNLLENRGHTHFCRECYDLDMCQNSEKSINVGEVGDPEGSFWH